MKLIDLSYPIEEGMPVYPGDEKPELARDRSLDRDGYNNFLLRTEMHAGTHIDSPMHMTESGFFIADYPAERFCGPACLLDVRGKEIIGYEESHAGTLGDKKAVLFFTGFEDKYGKKDYYSAHPEMDMTMAEFLVHREVKLIGMDMPSPDRYPFDVHKYLLSNDICILENLCNMKSLAGVDDFEIFAFPLKIKADASPVRAVAKIDMG